MKLHSCPNRNEHEEHYWSPSVEALHWRPGINREMYTEDGLDAIDSHRPMAKLIWETSRGDENSVSAMGADIIAKTLIAHGYGKISQEKPQEPQPKDEAEEEVLVASARDAALVRKGIRLVILWMLGSDDIPDSQSGTLWRFVRKVAREFGIDVKEQDGG